MSAGGMTIKMTERHPPMVFKRMSTDGAVTVPPYRLLSFGREEGDEYSYRFSARFQDGRDKPENIVDALLGEFKVAIVEDYAESYSDTDVATLFVDFPERWQAEGVVEGRGVVVAVSVTAFEYSPHTRLGSITVKFNGNQSDAAREYVKRNIATICRDKNIALVTGEVPSDATIQIVDEALVGGDTMKVGFKAVN